jgi:hypothetical protein
VRPSESRPRPSSLVLARAFCQSRPRARRLAQPPGLTVNNGKILIFSLPARHDRLCKVCPSYVHNRNCSLLPLLPPVAKAIVDFHFGICAFTCTVALRCYIPVEHGRCCSNERTHQPTRATRAPKAARTKSRSMIDDKHIVHSRGRPGAAGRIVASYLP